MSVEENKAVVRTFIDEVILGGKFERIGDLVASDCVNHAAVPQHRIGIQGLRQVLQASLAAQPDQKWESQMWIAEGDLVVVHAIRRATWQATSFRGVTTPTNRPVEVELVHIFRVRDRLIVEHWAVRDDLGLLKQLGVMG
jgi:predicted ester cyclase